jgi:hypothetical protein
MEAAGSSEGSYMLGYAVLSHKTSVWEDSRNELKCDYVQSMFAYRYRMSGSLKYPGTSCGKFWLQWGLTHLEIKRRGSVMDSGHLNLANTSRV